MSCLAFIWPDRSTPLWPAGHLPLKGGDQQSQLRHLFCNVGDWVRSWRKLISPLEGEMPGRAEGGGSCPPRQDWAWQ
ncbi:hypothetical protein EET67_17835 [Pseudaminobacter arsenicus]|uniref:Lytic murein transglycosylase n=1 Tax=Borborobacter arsenicus TaxID=1851146 RepID=A0A432V2T2_9HYPH|nr:hypothetical protein EET67_17835 [Pseudaminobacter arsenicus]